MPSVKQIIEDIEQLNPSEQERILCEWMFRLHPLLPFSFGHVPANTGIVKTTDVCGGAPRIVRTRIPVWVLERMRQLGVSEAEILRSFPTLRAEDLVHAWAYVDVHRAEIDEQIRANEEA